MCFTRIKNDTPITRLPVDKSNRATLAFCDHKHYSALNMLPVLRCLVQCGIHIYGIYGRNTGLYAVQQIGALKEITGKENLLYLENAANYLNIDWETTFINTLKNWIK